MSMGQLLQVQYWNVQNAETGELMMHISTARWGIAYDYQRKYEAAFPGFHFATVRTPLLTVGSARVSRLTFEQFKRIHERANANRDIC